MNMRKSLSPRGLDVLATFTVCEAGFQAISPRRSLFRWYGIYPSGRPLKVLHGSPAHTRGDLTPDSAHHRDLSIEHGRGFRTSP